MPIINNIIERNFGGITYEIDIDFNLEPEDIKEIMEKLKNKILNSKDEDNPIKVASVFLFKKIYDEACLMEIKDRNNVKRFQIEKDDLFKYNLNKCIDDNINDNNSRYLLLEIKPDLTSLFIQKIKNQFQDKKDIYIINESPFSDDKNYINKKITEMKNLIVQKDKLIIIQNYAQIHPYLYELYKMNYREINKQKIVRMNSDDFSEQLIPVNDTFKIIVLADERFVYTVPNIFLDKMKK